MSGKRSKDKGKSGEREAAKELARLFDVAARRGCQYQGGNDSADIVVDLPGIHWEVKRCEALSLYTAMLQADTDAGANLPLVLHRRNNKKWLAVLYLDDLPWLVKLLSAVTENGNGTHDQTYGAKTSRPSNS